MGAFAHDELVQIDNNGNLIKATSTEWERHEKIIKSLNLDTIDFRNGLMARDSLPHGVDSLHIIESLLKGYAVIDNNWHVTFLSQSADRQLTRKVLSAISGIVMEECQSRESEKSGEKRRGVGVSLESFDDIIMSCDELLDVETEVNKSFKKWSKTVVVKPELEEYDESVVAGSVTSIGFLIGGGGLFVAASNIWFLIVWGAAAVLGAAGLVAFLADPLLRNIYRTIKSKKQSNLSEADRFEFLKNAYVGTIQKLNSKLDAVKDRIDNQVRLHEEDREQIRKYSDILDNTGEVLEKIEGAIFDLNTSKRRVSDKKGEVNRILEEYIGENGHIAKKEAELERIKIAQELSDRMKSNFKATMEITKSVDVLTDAIVPGIKRLMEFKIPQLINDIEFKCDKNKSYLQISQ